MTGNRQRRADLKTRLERLSEVEARDILDDVIDADDDDILELIEELLGEHHPSDPASVHPCACGATVGHRQTERCG